MTEDYEHELFNDTRRILREIREIKADCGYSTEEILLAMIASAILTKPLPVPIEKIN